MSKSKSLNEKNNRPWVVSFCFAIALALSSYLAFSSLQGGTVAGCGPDSSCDAILKSRWAYWFGLPVSAYSALFYIGLLVLLWIPGPWTSKPALRSTSLMAGVFLIPGAAFWFIGIQWLEFKGFCPYCMATHGFGVAGAFFLWRYLRGSEIRSQAPAWTPALGGLIGMTFLLALASGQMLGPAPATSTVVLGLDITDPQETQNTTSNPVTKAGDLQSSDTEAGADKTIATSEKTSSPSVAEESSTASSTQEENLTPEPPAAAEFQSPPFSANRLIIRLHRGLIQLPVGELPQMGNPDAKYWIISLFDYTCKHCRHMHHDLELALEKYGDQLGILSLPTPLDANCNPMMQSTPKAHQNACDYARLGLAVWRANPKKFPEFDEYLFQPETPPALTEATTYAAELIGAENLKSVLKDPWIGQQIQEDISLLKYNYETTGKGQMPQLLIGNALIAGTVKSVDSINELIESQFKIAPKQ